MSSRSKTIRNSTQNALDKDTTINKIYPKNTHNFSYSKKYAEKPSQAKHSVSRKLTGPSARDTNALLSLVRRTSQMTSKNIAELLLGSKKRAPGSHRGGKSRKTRKSRK